MSFNILDPLGIKSKIAGRGSEATGIPKGLIDPFGPDGFGSKGASGLFPKGAGGSGDITDMLAMMSGKGKDKDNFNTNGAGDGLFSGGKDFGSSGGGGSGLLEGIGGMVKDLLGGLLGGGGGGMMGGIIKAVMSFI